MEQQLQRQSVIKTIYKTTVRRDDLNDKTFGNVSNNMSTIAASRYSLQASAFLAICSDSALALAWIAKASASPRIRI